jgi:hypothetical protein
MNLGVLYSVRDKCACFAQQEVKARESRRRCAAWYSGRCWRTAHKNRKAGLHLVLANSKELDSLGRDASTYLARGESGLSTSTRTRTRNAATGAGRHRRTRQPHTLGSDSAQVFWQRSARCLTPPLLSFIAEPTNEG